MTLTQAEASRFFLNEELWLDDCQCNLDTSSLVIAKGEKSFSLTLNNIAFTGYRAKTDDKPAAVVLCQASGSGDASEDDERPEPFDDLLIEFSSTEAAVAFHKALESAVSDATAFQDIDMEGSQSSSSSQEDPEVVDLPSRMMQETQAAADAENSK